MTTFNTTILDDSPKKKKKITKDEKFSDESPCSHSLLMLSISTHRV